MTSLSPTDLSDLLGIPLSQEQLAAATAPLQPQLIVAGAGTGKTTVMAARVVWLVATGQVTADQVLGLTFTNKAAGELRQRIRTACQNAPAGSGDHEPGDATVLTYHAFAGQLLSQFGPLLGLEADQRMLTDGQRARLAYGVACDPWDATDLVGTPERLAEKIRAMDDELADLDVSLNELKQYDTALLAQLAATTGPVTLLRKMTQAAQERLRLADLVAQFRQAKSDREVMDFSDQVRLGSELAAGGEMVRRRLTDQYRVVLLDEYQDTSRAQRRTLQSLFGQGHAVTAVGDPCQAIYGWRGASVTNIDEFPHQFRRSDGTRAATFPLTINRRSLPAVLTVANDIATELRSFHDEVRELRSPTQRCGGRLACALLDSWDEELLWLSDSLSAARDRHEWHDMAVLCRSNDHVSAVMDHLRSLGVPAHVSSRRDLLALPEVRHVTSVLLALVDPFANPEVLHQLVGPRWRIGPRDLATLARRARDLAVGDPDDSTAADVPVSLLDAIHDPGPPQRYRYSDEALTRFGDFVAEWDHLDRLRDRPLPDLVAAVIDLLAPGIVPVDAAALPSSLHTLVDVAQQFRSLDGSRSLSDFVAYLADCRRFATSPQDGTESGRDAVTVMTMHAAKGLEFPLVALPGLSASVFPAARGSARWVTSALAVPPVAADEPDPALQLGFPASQFTGNDHDAYVAACQVDDRRDEDRLAYVAVTRAKQELLASGHWWGPTQKTPRGPSDYLLAVRRACESTAGAVGPWRDEPSDRTEQLNPEQSSITLWPQPVERPSVQQLVSDVTAYAVTDEDSDHVLDPTTQPLLAAVAALIADHRAPTGDVVMPRVMSASAVLAWLRSPQEFLDLAGRPMPRRPSPAAARGVAFHSWLEQRVGQQALFDVPGSGSTDADEFAAQLARTAYAERTPIAVEQPFVVSVSGLSITGRIDAVFPVTDSTDVDWEVVDWKTGRSAAADPAQLVLYRAAWAGLVGCDPARVRATFVFLADGSHTSYDDLVSPEQLLSGEALEPTVG